MIIRIESIKLSLTSAAEISTIADILDMAADNAEGQAHLAIVAIKKTFTAQRRQAELRNINIVTLDVDRESAQLLAVGCQVLSEWIDEDTQPLSLDKTEIATLASIRTHLADVGFSA